MIFRVRRAVRFLGAGIVAVALAVAAESPTSALAAPNILPHKAVYDLTLARSRTGATVIQAGGTLEFQWDDACKGWTISQRTRVRMVSPEGQVINFGWSLESHEAKDGSHYRFFIKRIEAGGQVADVRGEASVPRSGESGKARFTAPKPRDVVLPAGTLFPANHTVKLIETAMAGRTNLWRTVFDGSGEEGLFQVNATITRGLPEESAPQLESALLQDQESWRINLAFFGFDPSEIAPEYEQSLRLYANGVVDEMLLDYGEFALSGNLRTLETVSSGC